MKSKIINVFFLLLVFNTSIKAQNEPQMKFLRPSMTTTYIKSSNQQIEKIYESFKNTRMEARFDQRNIPNGSLVVNLPSRPVLPETVDPLEYKKAMADYKKSVSEWENTCQKEISKVLAPIGRKVFGDMLGRDANGDMSWSKIMEAAAYSATDGQALSAGASKNMDNVYQEIAEELLKKVYITVYDATSIKTYEQVYDAQDAAASALAAKMKKEFKPAKRVQEGWQIDFNYSIYKLVWNDSISNIFGNEAWLDSNVTDPAERALKKGGFDNFIFPIELALTGSSIAIASQSNDAAYYARFKIKRKSMDELLEDLPSSMQNAMVSKGGRKIDDFKTKAPVFQEKPLLVKLGTKEGIYYDERFYAYEIVIDKDGKKSKKRRGVLRASKIVDNSIIATGSSPASTFRQEGGKRIYQGTLVELKEDYGVGLSVGYGLMDKFVGGVNVGLEIRIPSILHGDDGYSKYLRGVYLNGNLGYNILSKGEVFEGDNEYSATSMAIGVSLSRETYLFRKGNIYIMPEIGGGVINLEIIDYYQEEDDKLLGSTMFVNGGLGIGLHVSPMVSIFAKAGFNMRIGDATWEAKSGEEEKTPVEVGTLSDKNGFDKLNSMSFPITAGLRFRF